MLTILMMVAMVMVVTPIIMIMTMIRQGGAVCQRYRIRGKAVKHSDMNNGCDGRVTTLL